MKVRSGEIIVEQFDTLVDFVQFKNAHHEGTGYLSDNSLVKEHLPSAIPLKHVFNMILDHFGIDHGVARELAA